MEESLKEKIACFRQIFSKLDEVQQEEYYVNFGFQFTHNSTAIEGNTLTYYETVTLIDKDLTPAGKTLRECHEVIGHDLAFKKMLQYADEKAVINDDVVCELHKLCMFPAQYAGIYRNTNSFINGAKTRVSPPGQIYQDLKFLFDDLLHHEFADPLEKAAYTHAEFVRIHPFPDGNGRTSRLLMNLILKSEDYPLICISNQNRQEYIETLDKFGVKRDLNPFYDFLAKTMESDLEKFFDRFRDLYDKTELGQKPTGFSL